MTEILRKKSNRLPAWAGVTAGFLLTEAAALGLVYYWRVFYYLDARGFAVKTLTLCACGLAAAIYAAAMLAAKKLKRFDARGAACILLCGLLFVFANPPMQTADETVHFLRAYSISTGHFDFDAARSYPEDVNRLMASFPGAWVNAHTSVGTKTDAEGNETVYDTSGYALKQYGENGTVTSVWDGFADYFSNKEAKSVSEPLSFVILPYLPAALGMLAARLLGFSALGVFYGGRIANLLVYVLLCRASLKNCKRYKPVFLAVMLLPLSLSMAASLNYDAIALGCYYCAASFYCKDEITDRDVRTFFAVFLAMNVIKPWINLLWLALPLVLPKTAWKTRWKKWQLAAVCVAAAVTLSLAIVQYGNVFRFHYPEIGRMLGGTVDGAAQLEFILKNPLRFVAVALGTLYENSFFLGRMGLFGALDLPIEVINVFSPLALGLGAMLSVHERSSLKPLPAAGLFGFSLFYMGSVMASLYITYTPVGMVRILGLQARYFLPGFLLLAVLAAALLSHVLEPRQCGEKPLRVALWCFGAMGLAGAVLLFQHYFIGPVYTI